MIQQSPSEERAGMSACNKCGAQYPSAPPDHIHKCGECSGRCYPLTSQAAQPAEADGVTASEKMWRIARFMGEQTEREAIVDWLKSMGDSKPHGTDWRTYYEIAEAIDEGRHEDAAAPKVPATDAGGMRDTFDGKMIHAVASLRAAISLLEKGGKKAAPSDKMFAQMLMDYHKAADAAAKALATPPAPNDDTVAFVQKWLMNADYDPSQFDKDFAAAIDARCATPARNDDLRAADPFFADRFADMWDDYTEADWQIVKDPTSFLEECEDAGLAEWVPVDDDALEEPFAHERGIEPGGMMWQLTAKGQQRYSAARAALKENRRG